MPLPHARMTCRPRRLRLRRTPAELYAIAHRLTREAHGEKYRELVEIATAEPPAQGQENEEDEQQQLERERAQAQARQEALVFRECVFGAATLQPGHRVFAVGRIAIHGLAVWRELRHDDIPGDATDVALDWSHTVDVDADQELDIQLALYVDRGDAGTLRIGLLKRVLPRAADLREGDTDLDPLTNDANTLALDTRLTRRRIVTPAPPSVARSTQESSGNVNLVSHKPTVFVEITEIEGLYRPIAPAWEDDEYRQSRSFAGYTSADQDGRIFTSRAPDGAWTPYTQHIVLHARVTVPGMAAALGAVRDRLRRLSWSAVEDRDDPIRFSPFVHRDTRAAIDGALRGFADRGGQHRFQWLRQGEQDRVSAANVDTDLAWAASDGDAVGTARVRLYCPHVGGDRFRVRAGFAPSGDYDLFAAETGAMTMWKRIYVDYHAMPEARALPITKVPGCFDPACIELVFARHGACASRRYIVDGEDVAAVEPEVLRYMNQRLGAPAPGRFQLVAARRACRRAAPAESDALRIQDGRLRYEVRRIDAPQQHSAGAFSLARLEAPAELGDLTGRKFAAITLNLGDGVYYSGALVDVEFTGGRTRFWVEGHDLARSFDRCDGSVAASSIGTRRYFPGRFADAPMEATGRFDDLSAIVSQAGGYPVGDADAVHALAMGGGEAAEIPDGVSPTTISGGRAWFAGRTMLFTRDPGYDQTEIGQVVVIAHELTHAFGMPHKCGRYDVSTPRLAVCNMNYPGTRMLVGDALVAGHDYDRHDAQHCVQHVRALRAVRLETNRALGWGGE